MTTTVARPEAGRRGAARARRAHVFGGLQLLNSEGQPVPAPVGKARSLLAYLLLHREPAHSRERLSEALWPEEPAERAGRSLADALYRLRQSLKEDWLATDRTTIRLRPPPDLWVDLWEFERLLEEGLRDSIAAAVRIYSGELLPEVYDDWIVARRVELADAYRTALTGLAERAEADGELLQAFHFYHWLTAADPLDEAGHRGLMRSYLRAGHSAAALQQFEQLSTLLRDELDLAPAAESQNLAETARQQLQSQPAAQRPFVGRRHERAALLERLEGAANGAPALVLLEGEAGIGKSRLLDILAEDLRWRGFDVGASRVDDHSAGPFAPLDAALATLLSPAALDRLGTRLSPAARSAIASLLPAPTSRLPVEARARPNLPIGLAALWREVTEARPWVLMLDDVHLAGPAFWEALGALRELESARLAIILAYRPDIRSSDFAWQALRRLDADLAPVRLTLSGLSPPEGRALATALGRPMSDEQFNELHRLSGGNPLYLQQAIVAEQGVRAGLPGFVELLDNRMERLSPAALGALRGAAVLGPSFTFAEWLSLLPDEAPAALDEVVKARFVVEMKDRYALEHDLVREHVYQSMPGDRRAELHRQAATILRRERSQPAALAWHLEQGGLASEAVVEYERAAQDASKRYAPREALTHIDRALELAAAGPDNVLPLLSLRHRVLGHLLLIDEWRAALQVAEDAASEANDQRALMEVLEGRLSLHTLDGDVAALEATGLRAIEVSRAVRDGQAEARLLATLGWHISESLGESRRALPMLRRAARLAAAAGDEGTQINALCMLSSALRSVGRSRAGYASATQAMAVVATRPHLERGRAHALAELAESALDLGRWQEGLEAMRGAVVAYRELDDPWSYGSALFGLVNICAGIGLVREALAAAHELIDLSVRVGLAPASDFGIWHRVSLARAHLAGGDVAAAEDALVEVGQALPDAHRPRIALLGIRGQLALERGRPREAVAHMRPAFELWRREPETRDAALPLWLAIAASRAGNARLARRALTAAADVLRGSDIERLDVLLALAHWEVSRNGQELLDARADLRRQATRFTDERLREVFEQSSLFARALDGRGHAGSAPQAVRLARSEVPLGRPVRSDEHVEVVWALADPGSADGLSKAEQRRTLLLRLTQQARDAGGLPTDDQLARALGVSRRTVLRDVRVLAAAGQRISTRRRNG